MKIVLVYRSKKLGYHSIENVFGTIQKELMTKGEVEAVHVENRGFSLTNLFALKKFVNNHQSDTIYHVTGDIHYVVFALPRKRTMLTIHDCVFINKRKGVKGWIIKKLFLDWPVWYAPAITAISEKTKNEIISLTGCNPDKIKVISNPVSTYIRHTEKTFNSFKPVLLFIGSRPNKNLARVIEALRGFCCTLHIIGQIDEKMKSKLNQYDILYNLEHNLRNEEMAKRYERADIILFPSLYEGFGLPVIEGFKAGRAVLTSDISPMKELADGAAWLVDPYSANSIRNTLEKIVNEKETRTRKIQNGFYIVHQYLPENVASLYYKAYSDLDIKKPIALAT